MAKIPDDLDEAALREIRSQLLELKDKVVLRLARGGELNTTEMMRLRKHIDGLKAADYGERMESILSRYMAWSFERGIENIDRAIEGANLQETLRVPQGAALSTEIVEQTKQYDASLIKSIPVQLLGEVREQLTLAFLASRPLSEIVQRVVHRFDVSESKAMTIIRTEGNRITNHGSEHRIKQVGGAAREIGIPMLKYWIHSSGSSAAAGPAVKGARTRAGFSKGAAAQGYEPRPHHKAMHGRTIPFDAKFLLVDAERNITYEIDGPHAPGLPVHEVVNCACQRSIRIDEDAMKLFNSESQTRGRGNRTGV